MSVPSNKGLVFLALVVAILAASLLATSMGFVPSSLLRGDHGSRTGREVLAADTYPASASALKPAVSCLPTASSQSSPAMLQKTLFSARQHAESQRYNEALAEFRNLANVDPAMPGLNLNISMSLMQLKRTEEAKAAIDTQLNLSDCLAKLPSDQFAAYCRSEMPLQSTDSCRQQTQDIRRTAHMQAALVEMELGRNPQAGPTSAVAVSLPEPRQGKPAQPAMPAKHPVDQSLARGTGTDAELGAYSK